MSRRDPTLILVAALLFTASAALAQPEPQPPPVPAPATEPQPPPVTQPPKEPQPPDATQPAAEQATTAKPDPCQNEAALNKGWIDRIQYRLASTVCGSAVWFDGFFGDTSHVDPDDFRGRIAGGFLHKTNLGVEWKSRFDVDIPLRNFERRTKLFFGRTDEDTYISDVAYGPGDEIGALASQAGEDWLLGLGYSPIRTKHTNVQYRLGAKASSDPYAFGQARFRYLHEISPTRVWQAQETLFYRTDDDGFGTTTSLTFDWKMGVDHLGRASATATYSEGTEGIRWKYQMVLYENLGGALGRERAVAYKAVIRGETEARAEVPEYGVLATYRQQFLRPWLFGEITGGYSWDVDEETDYKREGSVNYGLMLEIRFGDQAM